MAPGAHDAGWCRPLVFAFVPMLLQDFLPSPPLRECVRIIQVIHFVFPAGVPLPFKAYPPRPEQCLAFYPRDAEAVAYPGGARMARPRSVLIGQHVGVSNRYVGREFLALQVVLQPGALYRLTGIPQAELTNTFIDAEAVWAGELRQLNERLGSAAAWPQMLPLIEQFLLGRLQRLRTAPPHPADAVGQLLLRPGPRLPLDALAGHACLSPRQLDRQFAQRMGVGPALYARIVRFDRAFRLKNSQPNLDWLSVALACGYYDHQHLAKDYRDFTGGSPSAFFLQDTQAPERGFGLVEA